MENDIVLATLKGKPIVTVKSLQEEKKILLQAHRGVYIPEDVLNSKGFDRNLLEQVIGQKIVDEYVIAHKINEAEAYKKELDAIIKNIVRQLNMNYFSEAKIGSVSDDEVKAFYDNNKDLIPASIIPGGIRVNGISFDDAVSARAFMTKASNQGFEKAADNANLNEKIEDFGVINNQRMDINRKLRDKILATKKVPSIELFDVYWVMNLVAKEEKKYMPFELIQANVKQQVSGKRLEVLNEELAKLKEEYHVQINEDYFEQYDAD